jgi:phosphoglucomutase
MKKSSTLPENGFVVKTIVTTECARAIANNYNIPLLEVLTGFKFIGEKIKELDEFGEKKFLFGFEESYGYLAGSFARDKDGVVTCMLIAEMAGYFKSKGMTLYDALIKLYEKYGYYIEEISSFTLEGKVGMEKIINTMTALRENRRNSFGSCEILAVRDYLVGEKYSIESGRVSGLDLPKSNVIYYEMASGGWVAVRPSGTEPKIKIYFGESGKTESEAKDKLDTLKNCVVSEIQDYLGA